MHAGKTVAIEEDRIDTDFLSFKLALCVTFNSEQGVSDTLFFPCQRYDPSSTENTIQIFEINLPTASIIGKPLPPGAIRKLWGMPRGLVTSLSIKGDAVAFSLSQPSSSASVHVIFWRDWEPPTITPRFEIPVDTYNGPLVCDLFMPPIYKLITLHRFGSIYSPRVKWWFSPGQPSLFTTIQRLLQYLARIYPCGVSALRSKLPTEEGSHSPIHAGTISTSPCKTALPFMALRFPN